MQQYTKHEVKIVKIEKGAKRHRWDSNPRVQSTLDQQSNALTTRPQCQLTHSIFSRNSFQKSEQKTDQKTFKIFKISILEKNKKKGKIGFTGYKVNLVQLYNIDEDPTEKKDVSSDFPKVVNVMLTKLADYYVSL